MSDRPEPFAGRDACARRASPPILRPSAMIRPTRFRPAAAACFAALAFIGSAEAFAQAPPLRESIVIGAWTFRPSVEARIRGEYRRDAFQSEHLGLYSSDAVLADGYNSNLPPLADTTAPAAPVTPATDVWSVAERIRLGLAVDRGPVTAMLKLQDARVLGGSLYASELKPAGAAAVAPPGPGFAPYEAYIDLHARTGRPMFLRVGRQAVQWGDGRLIGSNDFTATGRALDAARFGVELGDFDIEAMAALLGFPYFASADGTPAGATALDPNAISGTQLYGLDLKAHFLPLLHVELTGLARIARPPEGQPLTPSDTFVVDARIFGDYRGFHYALEGAYELGQVASYGEGKVRSIEAPAFAGRLEWETALPWHLTLGAQGAYASGDSGTGSPDEKMTRFDPILPDETSNHSRMSLYAWSNLIEAGGDIAVKPSDEVSLGASYRFVGLANSKGRWVTGALTTVGSDPTNEHFILGHEIDATIRVTPWDPVTFQGGYGLFLLGDGGKNILKASGREAEMQHWGYLQATVRAP